MNDDEIKNRSGFWKVTVFYLGALFISGGIMISYILITMKTGKSPGKGILMVAASGASISGILVTLFFDGKKGLKSLLSGLLKIRIKWYWFVLSIFLFPLVLILSSWIASFFGSPFYNPLNKLPSLIPVFLIITVQAGIGEEIGWRGVMTPELNKRFKLVPASIITGILWGIWHTPLFFTPDMFQFQMAELFGFVPSMLYYMVFLTSSSVIYSIGFTKSKGSLLVPILFHGSLNTGSWLIGANELENGTYPLAILTIMTFLIAIIFILIDRKSRLQK
jgi:membrane protease YdiL (CAAX protease family)